MKRFISENKENIFCFVLAVLTALPILVGGIFWMKREFEIGIWCLLSLIPWSLIVIFIGEKIYFYEK